MKKAIGIVAAIVFMAAIAFASYKLGEKNLKIVDDPTESSKTTENTQEEPEEDETIPIEPVDNMSTEEITQYLRGKVFQLGHPYMAAGLGEVFCFAPEGNGYYWFCSSMDEQARVRAEYGTWALSDGYITFNTEKLVEWQGGHFAASSGSTGSRYELVDYDELLTEVDIESEFNFNMFKFPYGDSEYEFGFYCAGYNYFYAPGSGGMDYLREEYEGYFALLED